VHPSLEKGSTAIPLRDKINGTHATIKQIIRESGISHIYDSNTYLSYFINDKHSVIFTIEVTPAFSPRNQNRMATETRAFILRSMKELDDCFVNVKLYPRAY